MANGYVYVVTNPCLRNVETKEPGKTGMVPPVKIGMAKDVAKRMGVLNTSTPENFVDRLVVELSSERDALALENMVHEILASMRLTTSGGYSTEFFACSVEHAIATVKRVAKKLHFKLTEFKHMNFEGRSASAIKTNHAAKEAKKESKKGATVVECIDKQTKDGAGRAKPFSFDLVGIKSEDEIVFAPTGVIVKVADAKHVECKGKQYSLSGFCKAFMPEDQRNKSGAYCGPDYFTFNGCVLTNLRKAAESGVVQTTFCLNAGEAATEAACGEGESWKGKTQLAKALARRGGNEGAYGGILHYFSRYKPCGKMSKWRKLLADAGIKFDDKDYVIDWSVAQNPLKI